MRGTRAFWVLFAYAARRGRDLPHRPVAHRLGEFDAAPGRLQSEPGSRVVLDDLLHAARADPARRSRPTLRAPSRWSGRSARWTCCRATLLTASDVVTGKLLVVLGLGLLLLLTSLPIACWSLLLGGVAPEEVFYSSTAISSRWASSPPRSACSISALLGRSVGAVVATYGTLLAVVIVPLILMGVFLSLAAFRGSGVGLPLGDIWGAILLSALCLVCAWLLYLAFQWLWRRFLGTRLRFISYGLPAILLIIGLFQVLRPGSHALLQASSLQVYWLFLLEPFLGVVGILEGSNAISGIFSMMGARTSGINLQLFIWAGCTGAALLCAILCWALSIRAFRARG